MDPQYYRPPVAQQLKGLGLFEEPGAAPPAPSAPGSISSGRGSMRVAGSLKGQYRVVLLTLAAAGRALSRDELRDRTNLRTSSLCGRLYTLRGLPLNQGLPVLVERVPDACRSDAGLLVDGYVATKLGRDSVR